MLVKPPTSLNELQITIEPILLTGTTPERMVLGN